MDSPKPFLDLLRRAGVRQRQTFLLHLSSLEPLLDTARFQIIRADTGLGFAGRRLLFSVPDLSELLGDEGPVLGSDLGTQVAQNKTEIFSEIFFSFSEAFFFFIRAIDGREDGHQQQHFEYLPHVLLFWTTF